MNTNKRYEVANMRGNLHKSSVKSKENSPDMFGTLNIEGKMYKLSAWSTTSQSGNKYLSLSAQLELKPKDEEETSKASISESDLPF
mgnify:CR=1 FL=1|tara:strand:+ start:848 stop:1105 length:258 start_codon:yes stop_codon:yes gene_type:complete